MKIIERNLQELGKSLFVSLPKEWTSSFKLKKGSKIKMIVNEKGILSIAPEFTKEEKTKESEIVYDKFFKRRFFREYFIGNEKITINLKNISSAERKELYSFLKRFITVQIIEESESKILLKSFKIEELSIEECMKRLYFLSLSMIDELLGNNDKIIQKEMRDNMTRFYYLLVMQIRRYLEEGKFAKENQIPLIRAMDYRMVAEKMQRIGELIKGLDGIKNKDIQALLKEIREFYFTSTLSFINNNYSKAPIHWEEGERIEKEYEKLCLKIEKTREISNILIMKDVSYILRYSREISELIR